MALVDPWADLVGPMAPMDHFYIVLDMTVVVHFLGPLEVNLLVP